MAIASAVTIVDILPMFLTGALAVQLRRDLGFDQSELGIALGVFLGVGAVFSSPSGRLADRFGPTPGLRTSALIACASLTFIGAFADSWPLLVGGLALGGLANAIGQPSANLFIARRVAPTSQGRAFGFRQSAAPAGSLLGGVAVPVLALTVGWRWAFIGAGVAAAAAAVLVPREGLPPRRERQPAPVGAPLRRGPLVLLAVASGFGFAMASGLTGFLVDAAVLADFSEGTAGLLLSVGSTTAIITRVVLGWHADRRASGHLQLVVWMLVAGAAAFACLAVGSKPLMVLGTVLGFATAWGWSGLFQFSIVRLNQESAGAATGLVQTGSFIGGVVGPVLFGIIVERGGYSLAWPIAAVWCLIAAGATLGGRHWDRRLRQRLSSAVDV